MSSTNKENFTWSGPVPVSLLSKLATGVLEALRRGQTVAVSRRGEIVAAFMPTTSTEAAALVDIDDPGQQLSARELERGNVSAAVDRAAEGERLVVTYQNRPLGLLRPVEDWQLLTALTDPTVFGDPAAPLPADLVPGPLHPAELLQAVPEGHAHAATRAGAGTTVAAMPRSRAR